MLSKDKNYYLLIGYGSVAKKHIDIIKKNDPNSIIYVYLKNKKFLKSPKVKEFISILNQDIITKINFVFILSPSSTHKFYLDIFIKYKSIKIFIEKPVFDKSLDDKILMSVYVKNSKRIFINKRIFTNKKLYNYSFSRF